MATNKPVREEKLGRVRAALWANETKFGTRYSVRFSRSYRDKDGKFHDSDSFDIADLAHIEKLAERLGYFVPPLGASETDDEEQAS
jgi:hypothetical protein